MDVQLGVPVDAKMPVQGHAADPALEDAAQHAIHHAAKLVLVVLDALHAGPAALRRAE